MSLCGLNYKKVASYSPAPVLRRIRADTYNCYQVRITALKANKKKPLITAPYLLNLFKNPCNFGLGRIARSILGMLYDLPFSSVDRFG